MSVEENIKAIRRYVSMWDNQKWRWHEKDDWSEYLEVIDPEFIVHHGSHVITGMENFVEGFKPLFSAVPDFRGEIDEIFASEESVACRFRGLGTHTGNFGEAPATGNRIEYTGTGIYRMKNGRFIEAWVNDDELTLMQQIGVISQ